MPQIAVLDLTVTASTPNEAHPHTLDRVPTRVFIVKDENEGFVRLAVTVTAATANEAHAHGLGVIPDLVILDRETSDLVTVGNPADATNIYLTNAAAVNKPAVAHCLVKKQVTVGTTASDATNIYLTNAKAEDQDVRVVVCADHSIIV